MSRYDWDQIVNDLELTTGGWGFGSIRLLVDYLGIPYATVYSALKRGDLPGWLVAEGQREADQPLVDGLRPIAIGVPPDRPRWAGPPPPHNEETVLFIADPHVGFVREAGGLRPMHDRPFLTTLLRIAQAEQPDYVVWNGDALDLADWSRFDTEPELIGYLQLAGIELAWLLAQFRRTCRRQVVLEGNHEVRLRRALVRYLGAGHSLRPVNDPNGAPLLSIERFLGLNHLRTDWVGGYPTAHLRIGSVMLTHGSSVRSGSGRTTAFLARSAAVSKFYGHVHRHELVRSWVDDLGHEVWVGSPGCACDRRVVPGATGADNWQLGAFLIHLAGGRVVNVEHISGELDGPSWFRGRSYGVGDYVAELTAAIPEQWARWL